ncbi:MAG: alpha/beta fold hydrolase [Mycobacteriaceae bacterium]|nr:alpha/beta fold hydrolase [Mycobacteriaceae bacterium]
MSFFDGPRGALHDRRWLAGAPAAGVALLPGLGQHPGHDHRVARALGAAGVETWGLDTAGHGLSEGDPERPGSLPELAADAQALLTVVRAERPTDAVIFVGHSLGAATAVTAVRAGLDCTGLIVIGTPSSVLGKDGSRGPALPDDLAVLALHGVDDRRAPVAAVRTWSARHPRMTLREYPDAGHDLLHEPVHRAVTADIVDWILRNEFPE